MGKEGSAEAIGVGPTSRQRAEPVNEITGLGVNGNGTMIGLDNFGTVPSQGTPVPEPGTLLLLVAGFFGVCLIANRKIAQK